MAPSKDRKFVAKESCKSWLGKTGQAGASSDEMPSTTRQSRATASKRSELEISEGESSYLQTLAQMRIPIRTTPANTLQ